MSNENPTAFPVNDANLGGPGAYSPEPGMLLRDYFAAKATEDDVAKWVDILLCNGISSTREQAKFAYADAMLAARKQTP